MKVAPQKIKIEYWAGMTYPRVRENLFAFAQTITGGGAEFIPCYQQS
jgi:hypothetical protein